MHIKIISHKNKTKQNNCKKNLVTNTNRSKLNLNPRQRRHLIGHQNIGNSNLDSGLSNHGDWRPKT